MYIAKEEKGSFQMIKSNSEHFREHVDLAALKRLDMFPTFIVANKVKLPSA